MFACRNTILMIVYLCMFQVIWMTSSIIYKQMNRTTICSQSPIQLPKNLIQNTSSHSRFLLVEVKYRKLTLLDSFETPRILCMTSSYNGHYFTFACSTDNECHNHLPLVLISTFTFLLSLSKTFARKSSPKATMQSHRDSRYLRRCILLGYVLAFLSKNQCCTTHITRFTTVGHLFYVVSLLPAIKPSI